MTVYSKFLHQLTVDYPRTATQINAGEAEQFSPHLICPVVLTLKRDILDQAQNIVRAFFELRESPAYKQFVFSKIKSNQQALGNAEGLPTFEVASFDPGNFSALTCFDFHLIAGQELKLIEINTNASMGLTGDLLYRAQNVENPYTTSFRDLIWQTFVSEFKQAKPRQNLETIAIVDENPRKQKMFTEFLLYKEFFEKQGAQCIVGGVSDLQVVDERLYLKSPNATTFPTLDLIYNRHTDFYLQQPQSKAMQGGYLKRLAVVTPNPHEYALLADKERLEDLTSFLGFENADNGLQKEFQISQQSAKLIASALLKTIDVHSPAHDPHLLWQVRKRYFFKPKRSFGGKAAYRGASVTRNVFDNVILKGDYVAQEYAPPPTLEIQRSEEGPGGEMKWDLRFFVYKDQIQMAIARVYQGQITNFKSIGGGLAIIREG